MAAEFVHQHSHVEGPRPAAADGRLVLSRLPQGRSLIARSALSLKIVMEGEERYEIGGRSHVLRPGEIMVVEPGSDMHVAVRGQGAAGLCLYMPVRERGWTIGSETLSLSPLILPLVDRPFQRWLSRLGPLLAGNPSLGAVAADRILLAGQKRLQMFLGSMSQRSMRLPLERPAQRSELLRRIETARAYLHAHPHRNVTLAELAEEAGLSAFHLSRCFREVHGLPPATYHRTMRLELAANLLMRGKAYPAQIARELGFADQASFTKAFVRKYGTLPGKMVREPRLGEESVTPLSGPILADH